MRVLTVTAAACALHRRDHPADERGVSQKPAPPPLRGPAQASQRYSADVPPPRHQRLAVLY